MAKIDPYKHKERYISWKEKIIKTGISEISEENSEEHRGISLIYS